MEHRLHILKFLFIVSVTYKYMRQLFKGYKFLMFLKDMYHLDICIYAVIVKYTSRIEMYF